MSDFKKSYQDTIINIGGVQGNLEGELYSSEVQKSVEDAIAALQNKAEHLINVDEKWLKGWLAEQWHAKTFETDAAARGREIPSDCGWKATTRKRCQMGLVDRDEFCGRQRQDR